MQYLRQRWEQGCHYARQLYRELRTLGYQGSERRVHAAVYPWRTGRRRPRMPGRAPPSHWLVLKPATLLTEREHETLKEFLECNPALAEGYRLKATFLDLIASRDGEGLDSWVEAAHTSGLSPFRRMAQSLRQDSEAVRASLSSPFSTGQCEGQICRAKLIKRLGYGRAKPGLLRRRVLHRPVA